MLVNKAFLKCINGVLDIINGDKKGKPICNIRVYFNENKMLPVP